MRQDQGDLLADFGRTEFQPQLANRRLQGGHAPARVRGHSRRPTRRSRLQAIQGGLQHLVS
jgi:hypothetical protein